MKPFFQLLYLDQLLMNGVDLRYLIQCVPLMTYTKPWKKSFNLSKTATYYRLLPTNVRHKDGMKHVHTVPVKLCRLRNDLRKKHPDSHSAMASVMFARELQIYLVTITYFSYLKIIKLVYLWAYQFLWSKLLSQCTWNIKLCYQTMTFQSELNISLFHLCIQRTWKKMARWVAIALHSSQSLREKCPNTELFLLRIFLHSDWIRRFRIELEVESMTKVAEQLILTVMREFYSLKSSRMRQLLETGKWKHLC